MRLITPLPKEFLVFVFEHIIPINILLVIINKIINYDYAFSHTPSYEILFTRLEPENIHRRRTYSPSVRVFVYDTHT